MAYIIIIIWFIIQSQYIARNQNIWLNFKSMV